jgi:hypothetical protein
VAEEKAEQMDTPEVLSDATAQAIVQAPVALLGARLTAPGWSWHLLGGNLQLVQLLAMIGFGRRQA